MFVLSIVCVNASVVWDACTWRLENSLRESVLTFISGDQTRIVRLGGKYLSLLNFLLALLVIFFLETESHIPQAGLKQLHRVMRMTLSF